MRRIAGGPRLLVWLSIVLCLLTAFPGVVDQGDLDARWINAVPALGVGLALGLTVAAPAVAASRFARSARGDPLRLVLAGLLLFIALPWMAAETGFYFPGDFFMGEEVPAVRDEGLAAVHLGFHHGMGGVMLALIALLLSRVPAGRGLRAYLSRAARLRGRERVAGRLERTALEAGLGRMARAWCSQAGALARLARDPPRGRRRLLVLVSPAA